MKIRGCSRALITVLILCFEIIQNFLKYPLTSYEHMLIIKLKVGRLNGKAKTLQASGVYSWKQIL